jgi:hypothetical protein
VLVGIENFSCVQDNIPRSSVKSGEIPPFGGERALLAVFGPRRGLRRL